MIEINLIPAALRKNKGGGPALKINIPNDILLGVGSGVVLLLLVLHVLLGAFWLMGYVLIK